MVVFFFFRVLVLVSLKDRRWMCLLPFLRQAIQSPNPRPAVLRESMEEDEREEMAQKGHKGEARREKKGEEGDDDWCWSKREGKSLRTMWGVVWGVYCVGVEEGAKEGFLDGWFDLHCVLAGPLARGGLVAGTISLVDVRDFGHERIVGVGIT